MRAREVYDGSDGELTKRYYAALAERGVIGSIAMNLFRAQKCSARAKLYRGGGYKGEAYERKNWSMGLLCHALALHSEALGIAWGWKQDPAQAYHNWVLYIDLPTGQVSFHAAAHGEGPDYSGDWNGQHLSAERILAFCDRVMGLEASGAVAVICAEPPAPLVKPLRFGDPDSIAAKRRRPTHAPRP